MTHMSSLTGTRGQGAAARVARPLNAVFRGETRQILVGRILSLRHRLRSVGRVGGLRSKVLMGWLVAGEVLGGQRAEPSAGYGGAGGG